MKKLVLLVIVGILLASCAPAAPSADMVQTAIAETQAALPTATHTSTAVPATATHTNTPVPTNTPRPTNTPAPTSTPTVTPLAAVDPTRAIAKNYVVSYESNGVVVEIVRVLIAEKSAVPQDFSSMDEKFDDKDTVLEIIYRITNNTEGNIRVYADQALLAVDGEQIDMSDYMYLASFGDDVGGEFLPGVTAIGGMWVGVERSAWNEVTKIIVNINAPYDDDYDDLGPDIVFTIDVVDWTFEPLPEELE